MVSNIDPAYPIAGIDQPSQGFRDNFSAAKTEIESLQGDVSTLQANPVITVIDNIGDVDTTTIPPISNDVLTFDGTNWVPLPPAGSSGLDNIVEDLTPQLGGDLDVNGNNITGSNIDLVVNDFALNRINLFGQTRIIGSNTSPERPIINIISSNDGPGEGPLMLFRRTRGTFGAETAVQSGDKFLSFFSSTHDGTSIETNFGFEVVATENHSVGNHGASTSIVSVANGSATAEERINISSQGQLKFNNSIGLYVLSIVTANGSATELLINGSGGDQLIISDDSTWFFRIHVVARRTDVNDESAAYIFEGVIDRNSGVATTALVGPVSKTVLAEDSAAWDANVDADSTGGALRITIQGEAAKTIDWVAKVDTVEITG